MAVLSAVEWDEERRVSPHPEMGQSFPPLENTILCGQVLDKILLSICKHFVWISFFRTELGWKDKSPAIRKLLSSVESHLQREFLTRHSCTTTYPQSLTLVCVL